MKKRCFIFVIFLILCCSNIWAQNAESDQEYIIQKNDTLWSISDKSLEDPFLWPKLWSVNPYISNPDLIYPGKRIIIPSREKLLMQELPPQEIPPLETKRPYTKRLKTPDKKAAPSSLEPYVKKERKYLVDKNQYISTGWISKDFPSIGTISSTPSGNKMAGKNDIVYIDISEEDVSSRTGLDAKAFLTVALNEHTKNRLFSIRKIKEVNHPTTKEVLGHLIRITGILEITGLDSNVPKARIASSFEDVQVGDGLMPYKDMEPPIAPDVTRIPKFQGHIVESLFTHELSGGSNTVYFDQGEKNGLQVGDVFKVFPDSSPDRVIGSVQIISLQSETAAALILKSSEEITIGDRWGQK